MGIVVFNIDGTAGRRCQCSHNGPKTWLNHWAAHSGVAMPEKCQAKGCRNYVEVGANVMTGDDRRYVWIIPFCQHHNKRNSSVPIELKAQVPLVGGSMTRDCA